MPGLTALRVELQGLQVALFLRVGGVANGGGVIDLLKGESEVQPRFAALRPRG